MMCDSSTIKSITQGDLSELELRRLDHRFKRSIRFADAAHQSRSRSIVDQVAETEQRLKDRLLVPA